MSKYEVGQKFTIELAEKFKGSDGHTLYRVEPFASMVLDKNGLDKLTPANDSYNAYQDGYEEGYVVGYSKGKDEAYKNPVPTQDAYNNGVRDMYMAMLSSARIWSGRNKDIKEWILDTNNRNPRDIVEKYKNLNCSIEDYLKEYLIEIGCEVRIDRLTETQYGIVTKIYKRLGKEYMVVLMQDGDIEDFEMNSVENFVFKTGKMYKIDEILGELNEAKEQERN